MKLANRDPETLSKPARYIYGDVVPAAAESLEEQATVILGERENKAVRLSYIYIRG